MSSEKEKLEKLSERIRRAEAKPEKKAESSPWREAGYDFAGTLVGAVIFGVLLDRLFGTTPWILVGMVVLGFVTGLMGVWKTLQKPDNDQNGN